MRTLPRIALLIAAIVGCAASAGCAGNGVKPPPIVKTPHPIPQANSASVMVVLTCVNGEPKVTIQSLTPDSPQEDTPAIPVRTPIREGAGFCAVTVTLPEGARGVTFGNGPSALAPGLAAGTWHPIGNERSYDVYRGVAGNSKGSWAVLLQLPGASAVPLRVSPNDEFVPPKALTNFRP